ncbi:MAG TPA: GDP-mannose 4,6-dehydratase [Candidatus Saccharimonadales bacterium]|nr:GDP-mannose 4,6-dehydratase [Candidatus Saccharimonadales bacterium]
MKKKVFITGGAGFIGSNAAYYFLKKGYNVTIFDNFSRKGSKLNVEWLKENFKQGLTVVKGDVTKDVKKIAEEMRGAYLILHLAGQVAVTTSVVNPREDFEVNALGTFNALEAVRMTGEKPIFIYSSTNKVYGGLEDLSVSETKTRYTFKNMPEGVSEERGVDFHSPYGCSKGAADQYVRDYSRIYGLNTIVFRQSCIYGPRQFGVEDQGWVAWFLIALAQGKNITIYGNGKQVRDLLYVEDLVKAYEMAAAHIERTKGHIYNIGGGAQNTLSVWVEFKPILEKLFGKKIKTNTADWRPGDQPIFIADIRKAKKEFGWEPQVNVEEGVAKLYQWVTSHKHFWQ